MFSRPVFGIQCSDSTAKPTSLACGASANSEAEGSDFSSQTHIAEANESNNNSDSQDYESSIDVLIVFQLKVCI